MVAAIGMLCGSAQSQLAPGDFDPESHSRAPLVHPEDLDTRIWVCSATFQWKARYNPGMVNALSCEIPLVRDER